MNGMTEDSISYHRNEIEPNAEIRNQKNTKVWLAPVPAVKRIVIQGTLGAISRRRSRHGVLFARWARRPGTRVRTRSELRRMNAVVRLLLLLLVTHSLTPRARPCGAYNHRPIPSTVQPTIPPTRSVPLGSPSELISVPRRHVFITRSAIRKPELVGVPVPRVARQQAGAACNISYSTRKYVQ